MSINFGTVTATEQSWGRKTITNIAMPSGFTRNGLKAFIISEAIEQINRGSDILIPGTTAQHTWTHPYADFWNIETMTFKIAINTDNTITAQVGYFGLSLKGSPPTISYAGDSEAKMWILGAIYNN